MLASARAAFARAAPDLLAACVQALRQHPQPPRGRPAYTTGHTAAGLAQAVGDDFLEITGPPHLQTLLTGRGPSRGGGAGGGGPLSAILAQWAQDKGIQLSGGLSYKSFGFLAARKMHREGSELYRTGQPSGLFDQVLTAERLDRLKADIAAGEMTAITSTLRGVLQGASS